MKRRKLTEILIETVETIIIRRRPAPAEEQLSNWCTECGRQVSLISPDAAAELARTGTRAIYRQIEAGLLHIIEASDGRTLVCDASVLKTAETTNQKNSFE